MPVAVVYSAMKRRWCCRRCDTALYGITGFYGDRTPPERCPVCEINDQTIWVIVNHDTGDEHPASASR